MPIFTADCEKPFVGSSSKKSGGFGGMFGMLKGLVGSKSLTREDMESVLDKMRDHLIGMIPHLAPILLIFMQHLEASQSAANHSSPSSFQQRM